jgi:hypothetical protein
VFEILIGLWLLVLAAIPKGKFRQASCPSIEPAWIGRLIYAAGRISSTSGWHLAGPPSLKPGPYRLSDKSGVDHTSLEKSAIDKRNQRAQQSI